MMITLNIISPQQKEELKLKKLYHEVKNLITIILLFTILAAIIILVARNILQKEFYDLVIQNTLISQNNQKVNRQIHVLNQQLQTINKIQSEYKEYTALFTAINHLIPPGIQFYYFKNIPQSIIEIKGRATSRTVLLNFKQNLEKAQFIKEVSLPVSSLLERENIDFVLSFKLTDWPQ